MTRSKKYRSDSEEETFLLLRYTLIAAVAYLFIFEGKIGATPFSAILIAAALLSNVLLSHAPKNALLRPATLGIIVCSDIAWIALGLWHEGVFGSDIFFLYFLILLLAAIAQNLILIVCASALLTSIDLILFATPAAAGATVWMSPSLVRIPFMFIAALFYGHLVEKVKYEKKTGEERIRALREIEVAMTSSLELRAILDLLLEKIDLFLRYAATTVTLVNKKTGELEPAACRNLDEKEWKAVVARRIRLGSAIPQNHAPVIVLNARTDPRSRQSDFLRKQNLVSYLRVPLVVKEDILGFLTFFTKEEHVFSTDEVELLTTLARQAAIAIYNSQLYTDLKRSNGIKDEFLGVMSHELRTPLNVVMGYARLLNEGVLGETSSEQAEAIAKIAERSKELLDIIDGILHATSIESREAKIDASRVDLKDLLGELKSLYEPKSSKEINLLWNYSHDLPSIETDGLKLKQILRNVINNAIKFTNSGSVTVSVRHFSETKQVEFQVADTGIGIPKDKIPFIFERFHQIDSSETRPFEGVGLGLYIAKAFTELLGGKVAVESEPEKGSTFTIQIPSEITISNE